MYSKSSNLEAITLFILNISIRYTQQHKTVLRSLNLCLRYRIPKRVTIKGIEMSCPEHKS